MPEKYWEYTNEQKQNTIPSNINNKEYWTQYWQNLKDISEKEDADKLIWIVLYGKTLQDMEKKYGKFISTKINWDIGVIIFEKGILGIWIGDWLMSSSSIDPQKKIKHTSSISNQEVNKKIDNKSTEEKISNNKTEETLINSPQAHNTWNVIFTPNISKKVSEKIPEPEPIKEPENPEKIPEPIEEISESIEQIPEDKPTIQLIDLPYEWIRERNIKEKLGAKEFSTYNEAVWVMARPIDTSIPPEWWKYKIDMVIGIHDPFMVKSIDDYQLQNINGEDYISISYTTKFADEKKITLLKIANKAIWGVLTEINKVHVASRYNYDLDLDKKALEEKEKDLLKNPNELWYEKGINNTFIGSVQATDRMRWNVWNKGENIELNEIKKRYNLIDLKNPDFKSHLWNNEISIDEGVDVWIQWAFTKNPKDREWIGLNENSTSKYIIWIEEWATNIKQTLKPEQREGDRWVSFLINIEYNDAKWFSQEKSIRLPWFKFVDINVGTVSNPIINKTLGTIPLDIIIVPKDKIKL